MENLFKEFLAEFRDFKNQVNSRFDKIENRLDNLENRLGNLENGLDNLEGKVGENTQILRALEHNAEVFKAELDRANLRLAKIEGNVNEIKENQKSIYEIIGDHEVAIRTLRRKPV
ncbi:MAG: hypothetical protein ACOYVD_18240 [Bacillota bacterium]